MRHDGQLADALAGKLAMSSAGLSQSLESASLKTPGERSSDAQVYDASAEESFPDQYSEIDNSESTGPWPTKDEARVQCIRNTEGELE